ncbi:MAG: hypothetical protein IVW56_09990 [Candidatus Binataceae bacterium]|nr:hypothetical protein [Candidatus Binataceae bacterium]
MARLVGKEWLYLAMALVGGIFGGVLGSRLWIASPAVAAESAPKTIAAQEIVLVDAAGKRHAALSLNGDAQPVFQMFDHGGKTRIEIGFGKDGDIGLALSDDRGKTRIALGISNEGVPALKLFDGANQPRALLGVDSQGESALDFYESGGKLLRELP